MPKPRSILLSFAAVCALVAGAFLAVSFGRPALEERRARSELADGLRLSSENQLDAAAASLRQALRRRPGLAEARLLLGRVELRRGRMEHAFLELQEATEIDPERADAWAALAEDRIAANQPEEAEAALTRALELQPKRPGALTTRAGLRLQFGRLRGALIDAERAIAAGEENAKTVLGHVQAALAAPARPPSRTGATDRADLWPGHLGDVMRTFVGHLRQQQWAEAQALAAAAGQDFPETMLGPWLEGVVALSRADIPPAEARLLEALRVAPRAHRPLTNLVAVWSKTSALHVADKLNALLAADPAFDYCVPIAARALLEADQPARAEATARAGLAALPGSPRPHRVLAELYLELDRGSEALAAAEQGLAKFPADGPLLVQLGRASLLLGDRARALAAYEKLLSLQPDHQLAAAETARLLAETKTDAASQSRALSLVAALEQDAPVEPAVLGAMGRVYLRSKGHADRARQVLDAAVRGAPEDFGLRYELAAAQAKAGDAAAATAGLRAVLATKKPFPEEAEARRLLRELGGAAP